MNERDNVIVFPSKEVREKDNLQRILLKYLGSHDLSESEIDSIFTRMMLRIDEYVTWKHKFIIPIPDTVSVENKNIIENSFRKTVEVNLNSFRDMIEFLSKEIIDLEIELTRLKRRHK